MKEFLLNYNYGYEINIFSMYHIMIILVTILLVLLIINNKEKFINISKISQRKLRLLCAGLLFLNFILRRVSYIYYGVFDFKNNLDISFCNFTTIIFFIYCITNNKKIYNLCYYMIFTGPLISILIPSVNNGIFNYSFYAFIIQHHLVLIFNIMFLFTMDYKYNKKDYLKYLVFILCYTIIIFGIDKIFNLRYNFPDSFINDNLLNNNLINYILNNNFLKFLAFYLIIFILSVFAMRFLKILKKK